MCTGLNFSAIPSHPLPTCILCCLAADRRRFFWSAGRSVRRTASHGTEGKQRRNSQTKRGNRLHKSKLHRRGVVMCILIVFGVVL